MAAPGDNNGGRRIGFSTGDLPLQPPVESEGPEIEIIADEPASHPQPSRPTDPSLFLQDKTVILVFNPKARGGRIKKELPRIERALKEVGANIVLVETHPDPQIRRQRIYEAVHHTIAQFSQFQREPSGMQPKGGPIYIVPYGGDGTLGETTTEALRGSGIELKILNPPSQARENLTYWVDSLINKGTAGDNSAQVGAPKKPENYPEFIRRSVILPFRAPIIETPGEEGPNYELAIHSFSFGLGARLFSWRNRWKAYQFKNPALNWINQKLSQGVGSFLLLLGPIIFTKQAWKGVEVEVKHFDREGKITRSAVQVGAENMVTPNRIMGKVAGIPGAWGNSKFILLPPAPFGLAGLLELIFRGLATKMGFNLVGPKSRLWFISKKRQWDIQPGERVELRLKNSGKELAILNGDEKPPVEKIKAYAPEYTFQMAAAPNSLGVRLARESAYIQGEAPPVSDQTLVEAAIEDSLPKVFSDTKALKSVRTPYFSQRRLFRLTSKQGVDSQRIPELLLATQSWQEGNGISSLAKSNLTIEGIRDFLNSPQRPEGPPIKISGKRALGERVLQGGVPLATGILGLFTGEHLADFLGLDPYQDRALRFGLVIYAAHGINTNITPLWEVLSNRMLHRPFDFIRTDSVRIAGETFSRYGLEAHQSLGRSLYSSWRTGALGLGVGLNYSLGARAYRLGTLPVRAAWNMGHGLIFSRLTETLLSGLPEDSSLRRYGPTLAFFTPDVSRILAPRWTMGLLGRAPMRLAGRAFAAGFLGDLTYGLVYRGIHGDQAGYEEMINYRTAELRRKRGDISWYSWRNVVSFLAPSLGAHLDSHDYGFGSGNSYRQEVTTKDREISRAVQGSLRQDLPRLALLLKKEPTELFREKLSLTPLERDMLGQILACRGGRLLASDASFEETAKYLRNQFSAYPLTLEQTEQHLARIYAHHLQASLGGLHQLDIRENIPIRILFDSEGRLKPGKGPALEAWVRTGVIALSS